MTDREFRTEAWNRYWATGADHSCATSFDLDGDGALPAFWRDVFTQTSSPACVVDLGTGNGGLLRLAQAHAARSHVAWDLIGVDLAQPRPVWADASSHLESVRFLAATPMESTGLPAASVDLLVSQYGVEYGAFGPLQDECIRILKANSAFAFVLHSQESIITRVAQDESVSQAFLLANGGLLSSVAGLLPHLAHIRAGAAPNRAAQQSRDAFNKAMEQGAQLAAKLAAPDLLTQTAASVQQFLSVVNLQNQDELQARLNDFRQEVASAKIRTDEQISSAMDAKGVEAFLLPFQSQGFACKIDAVEESGHLIAWAVTGLRP